MSKYHPATANDNILDAAMTALKPLVSPEVLAESEVAVRVPAGVRPF